MHLFTRKPPLSPTSNPALAPKCFEQFNGGPSSRESMNHVSCVLDVRTYKELTSTANKARHRLIMHALCMYY